jgi:hypothetical protein
MQHMICKAYHGNHDMQTAVNVFRKDLVAKFSVMLYNNISGCLEYLLVAALKRDTR